MAFPFRHEPRSLRDRILVAIGSSTVLGAIGCADAKTTLSDPANDAGSMLQKDGGVRTGTGGAGHFGSGGTTAMSVSCPGGDMGRMECLSRADMERKAHFGCGQIAKNPEPSDQEIADSFLPNGCLPKAMTCDGCCNPAAAEGLPQGDGSCCYTWCNGACCGRPLIIEGASRVAGTESRTDWLAVMAPLSAPDEASLRRRIAAEWLADAQMEHASIASFARFTLDLLAVGAPSDLVEAAQRAGLDEVVHARACFALAARYGAGARGPAPLDLGNDGVTAAGDLRAAALAAFREGCIGETLAAGLARAACERASDPEVRAWLARIADDEARHAELAYQFVAWAMQQEGHALAELLREDLSRALAAAHGAYAAPEDLAVRTALHAAGRLCAAERDALQRALLADVIAPSVQELIDSAPADAQRSAA